MYRIEKREEITFTNDFMFSKVMTDLKSCTQLIECLLEIHVEHIEYLNR